MKQKIVILKNNKEIFNGKIADIPIKDDYVIRKSIELFDDDDPCIIHKSYVYKEYIDIILGVFKKEGTSTIFVKDFIEEFSFIDYTELEKITIVLKG